MGLSPRCGRGVGIGFGFGFRSVDFSDVSRIDALPFDESPFAAQGGVPHPRPYLHLRGHRRQLYADCLVGHRRMAGRRHHGRAVGDGDFRNLLQVVVPQIDTGHQPDHLFSDGMDDTLFPAGLSAAGFGAAGRAHRHRWVVLYARGVVLCPQGIPLSPHGVASAHQSGGRRPLHRNHILSLLSAASVFENKFPMRDNRYCSFDGRGRS